MATVTGTLSVVVLIAGLSLALGVVGPSPALAAGSIQRQADVPGTAMNRTTQVASNFPELVADPVEPKLVVMANRLDAPDFSCALQVSGNGGGGWIGANPVPHLPAGVQKCYGPEVAFDGVGRLYYLFVGLSGAGNQPVGAFLTTSVDGGRTFDTPRRILGPLNFAVRMAIDPTMGPRGRIHLVWIHAGSVPGFGFAPVPNPILTAYSDNSGVTFSAPVQVSDPARPRVVAPALALGPDHGVDVAYYDLGRDAVDYEGLAGPVWSDTWSLVLARSTDGGRRFASGEVVDSAIVPPGRVMLVFTMPPPALAAQGNQLCAAWSDARFGDSDALARCSQDAGHSFGKAVRLNDDPVGNGASQYLPQLSVASTGRVDAIFFDRRRDPTNVAADVSYTYSLDGGRTFAHDLRLTDVASSSRIGQQYAGPSAQGQYEFGSRLGLWSGPTGALAAWPDTRNSLPDTTSQDIFTARVHVPRATRALWALVVGIVLALAGAVSLAWLGWRRLGGRGPSTSRRWTRTSAGSLAAVGVLGVTGMVPSSPILPKLPPEPHVVTVGMVEYRLSYNPAIPSGRVVFRIANHGRLPHSLWVIPLPSDMPPINVQLHGSTRRLISPFAGVPVLAPGQSGTFAVDLVAGQRYGVVCFDQAPDGQSEALKGMASEFRATAPRT